VKVIPPLEGEVFTFNYWGWVWRLGSKSLLPSYVQKVDLESGTFFTDNAGMKIKDARKTPNISRLRCVVLPT